MSYFKTAFHGASWVVAGLMLLSQSATAQEVRGVWSSRFQWPGNFQGAQVGTKARIDTLMNNLVAGKFNTAFFQVRGQCDGFYPSPYEPWSPIISSPDGQSPGWDPTLYAVNAAHSRGLKFHAYFNLLTIWQGAAPNISSYPNHVYYQHGNPADPAHRDWLLYGTNTSTLSETSEYVWMNPGIPAADAHVRREAMHLVSTYDIDGLHFDRARMPTAGYGKNPIAVARWDDPNTPAANDGPGNPAKLSWDNYMRDCVTRALMNICGQAWGIKKPVLMSSSPLGLWQQSAYAGYPAGYQYAYHLGQDAKAWMQMGAQDFIVPQIYWANGGSKPDFNDVFPDWQAAAVAAGRKFVPGSNMSNGLAEVKAHVLHARANGAAGHNIWHSDHADINYASWSQAGQPYENAAAFPDMPWRNTEGVITGHVYEDPAGTTPAVDAWVTRNGSTWTALSSGDGFFCFLRVPPGTYTLTIKHPTLGPTGSKTISNVVVTAGNATDINAMLPVSLSEFSVE